MFALLLLGLRLVLFVFDLGNQIMHLLAGLGHDLARLLAHGESGAQRPLDRRAHIRTHFREEFSQQDGSGANQQTGNQFDFNQRGADHHRGSRCNGPGVSAQQVLAALHQCVGLCSGGMCGVPGEGWGCLFRERGILGRGARLRVHAGAAGSCGAIGLVVFSIELVQRWRNQLVCCFLLFDGCDH